MCKEAFLQWQRKRAEQEQSVPESKYRKRGCNYSQGRGAAWAKTCKGEMIVNYHNPAGIILTLI